MKVTIKLFASFRDIAGWREKQYELADGATAGDALAAVRKTALLALPIGARPLLAVNLQHVTPAHALADGDEVGIFPPVSGGSGEPLPAVVGPDPIDARALAASVRHPSCGAVVTFEGTVRDHADGRAVESVEYEAYVDMARSVLAGILREVAERHRGVRLAAAHRTGLLPVGEVSVVVAAAAPHRREALAACRLVMDRIKESLPVWKQERAPTGRTHWK